MGDVLDDVVEEKSVGDKKMAAEKLKEQFSEFPEINLKQESDNNRINAVLSPDTAKRLDKLKGKLQPSTKTEAISKGLHLLETVIAAHESGAKFYLQKPDSEELVEVRINA